MIEAPIKKTKQNTTNMHLEDEENTIPGAMLCLEHKDSLKGLVPYGYFSYKNRCRGITLGEVGWPEAGFGSCWLSPALIQSLSQSLKLQLLRGEQEPTRCQHQLARAKGLILKNFIENVLHKVQQAI